MEKCGFGEMLKIRKAAQGSDASSSSVSRSKTRANLNPNHNNPEPLGLLGFQIKLWSYTWASVLGAIPMAILLVYMGRQALEPKPCNSRARQLNQWLDAKSIQVEGYMI